MWALDFDSECLELVQNISNICALDSVIIQRVISADFMDTLQSPFLSIIQS
jgi:hypothetical protein